MNRIVFRVLPFSWSSKFYLPQSPEADAIWLGNTSDY
jgi:hypothetical protein